MEQTQGSKQKLDDIMGSIKLLLKDMGEYKEIGDEGEDVARGPECVPEYADKFNLKSAGWKIH